MAQLFPRGDVRAVCTMGLNAADIPLGIGARPWRDLEQADLVVTVGQDLTQFAPVAGVRIRTARRASGARLAVLDARDTLLGSEADLWLRPAGAHLPAVLAALGGLLVAEHPERLAARPDAALEAVFAAAAPDAVEAAAGLAAGSLRQLAALIAAAKTPVFVANRGWFDPTGQVPRLLVEIDRLLGGAEAKGIIYLRTDCNSRGTAALVAAAEPELDGERGGAARRGRRPARHRDPRLGLRDLDAQGEVPRGLRVDAHAHRGGRRTSSCRCAPSPRRRGPSSPATASSSSSRPRWRPPAAVPAAARRRSRAIAAGLGRQVAFAARRAPRAPPLVARRSGPRRRAAAGAGRPGALPAPALVAAAPTTASVSSPRRTASSPRPALEVHPDDLAGLGLADGGAARLGSGAADGDRAGARRLAHAAGAALPPPRPAERAARGVRARRGRARRAGRCRASQLTGIAPAAARE